MTDEEGVIDLTDSFILADHCTLSDVIIDLAADDSFDVISSDVATRHVNKTKPTSIQKQDQILKTDNGLSDKSSSIFGDCPICCEEIGKNPLASTVCGHVYCLKCLESALTVEKRCPTCRRGLTKKSAYHPLYISKH